MVYKLKYTIKTHNYNTKAIAVTQTILLFNQKRTTRKYRFLATLVYGSYIPPSVNIAEA